MQEKWEKATTFFNGKINSNAVQKQEQTKKIEKHAALNENNKIKRIVSKEGNLKRNKKIK